MRRVGAGGLCSAARSGRAWRVQRLLGEGAVADEGEPGGRSALHLALQGGHVIIVQLLLRSGASVDLSAVELLLRLVAQRSGDGCLPPAREFCPGPRLAPSVARSVLKPHCFDAIDLAPFVRMDEYSDGDRRRAADAWDRCFRTFGFGLVKGHGIPDHVIADLRTAAMMFFTSPSNYKRRFYRGPTMTGSSGFSPMKTASSSAQDHSDPVEGYTFIRQQVTGPGGWKNLAEEHPEQLNGIGQRYCGEVERVMHAVHRMSALALGLDINFFEQFYTQPASVVVLSHYPPLRGAHHASDGKPRYRPHSDYSGFTVLLQDEGDFGPGGGAGLEIDIDGTWVPVKPQEGTLVINIGDLFELWTNDRWRSTPHRVSSPRLKDPASAKSRLTAMLFSGPNLDAIIEPIETCVDSTHPKKYAAMSAAKHLASMWKTKSKEAVYSSSG